MPSELGTGKFCALRREGRAAQLTAKTSLDSHPSNTPAQSRTLQTKQTTSPYHRYQGAGPTAAAEALFSNMRVNAGPARGAGPLKYLTDLPLLFPVGVLVMEQSSPSSRLVCVAGLKRLHTHETPGNVLTRRCSSGVAHSRANRLYQAVSPPLYASVQEFCLTRIAGYPRRSSTPT